MRDELAKQFSGYLRRASTAVALWGGVVFALGVAAQNPALPPLPTLPAPATPGGALPKLPPPAPVEEAAPGPFAVPPVVERPLRADAGGRVFVSGFRLTGVGEQAKKRVDPAEIEALLESFRTDKQGLEGVRPDGFMESEVAEITGFMQQVVARTDLDMQFQQYQALIDKLRLEHLKRRAGLSIGQLQEAANTVTRYYRQKGYILAQAFVPAQDVVDGIVTIEVLEGRLGEVLAEGNSDYNPELLAKPFEALLDAPITADAVESAILTVSDYPGLSAFAVFQPGQDVGKADIVLRVQEEKAVEGRLRLDNEGTRFTGDNRVVADVAWNNPTGAGDVLSGTFVKQFSPRNGLLFGAEYSRPFFSPSVRVGGRFEKNLFDVGAEFADLDVSGVTTSAELFVQNSIVRSRQFNALSDVRVRRSQSRSKVGGIVITQDDLAAVDARVMFDQIDGEARAINQGMIGGVVGLGAVLGANTNSAASPPPSRTGNDGRFADNHFAKLVGNYSRLQTISEGQTVLFRAEGQFSKSLLSSTDQFQIGGPSNLRAFPVSEFQVDSGVYASAEWTVAAPFFADQPAFSDLTWGQVLRVSFFTDFVWGDLNEPTDNDIESNVDNFLLGGYGMGVHLDIPGLFNARLQAAHPFGTRDASDRDNIQYWFDVNYTF